MTDIRKRYRKTIGINNILEDLLGVITDRKKSTIFKIEMVWSRALDKKIAQNCKPIRFSKGILFVSIPNPVWKNELLFFRKDLIERINSELRGQIIKEIIFQ